MILNVVETLAIRQTEKAEQSEVEFHKFVISLDAAKTAPDPDKIQAALDRFGKQPEELQAALNRLLERRRLAGLAAEVPQHREDYAKHQATLTEEVEQFAPVLAAHQQRVRELQAMRDNAKSGERYGDSALRELRDNCSQALRDAIKAASDRLAQLDDAIQRNGWDASDCEAEIVRKSDSSNCSYDEIDERKKAVERLTDELSKLKTEGERLAALRPPLVDELAKLREQTLAVESF